MLPVNNKIADMDEDIYCENFRDNNIRFYSQQIIKFLSPVPYEEIRLSHSYGNPMKLTGHV